ncbi:MAG: hypothetical protein UU08_C0015G0004 [Candidatus Uhrbacteria bacterium GW2011_GWE2_40_58]|nr:MAG: hypothetical protein UT94_C0014G0004 [Candidatus Uhrbacteria bacterium GW2011_GWF2_40_263]KKR67505.1 MAG: hypothetical protein UU08_C0015G0004 [Candidatus Uhrbacteria bacterium GW2011_GWE2_40_58]OGL93236.1 MAG: hypothetical protein A2239_00630 [Candidatus Uhrbacteria bacterium RIFOXYA2_FULL_40_9]OGL96433.1 MAG: hypothetical protein A2332_02760 [Candidatus Uhrbacteria bacterium RIFOXYB2_FULL_41_18]HBK34839.1 hypothetical protein [Candidatus Uhrbacteria bacterium]
MTNQFQRIFDLIRRTGDRMVVMDPKGDQTFVIMDIDQYEMLLDLTSHTEEENFDSNSNDFFLNEDEIEMEDNHCQECQNIWEAMPSAEEKEAETWDLSKTGEEEMREFEIAYQQFLREKSEKISKKIDKEEVISVDRKNTWETTEKSDRDFGEEQFYLEPIE